MTRIETLAALAALMGLSPKNAAALPTVIEVSARKVGMAEATMIAEAVRNAPLRAYLSELCAIGAAAL
jgi:hypothetical protein